MLINFVDVTNNANHYTKPPREFRPKPFVAALPNAEMGLFATHCARSTVCMCVSVTLCLWAHTVCKNGWTDWDAIWGTAVLGGPKKTCCVGPDPPWEGALSTLHIYRLPIARGGTVHSPSCRTTRCVKWMAVTWSLQNYLQSQLLVRYRVGLPVVGIATASPYTQ